MTMSNKMARSTGDRLFAGFDFWLSPALHDLKELTNQLSDRGATMVPWRMVKKKRSSQSPPLFCVSDDEDEPRTRNLLASAWTCFQSEWLYKSMHQDVVCNPSEFILIDTKNPLPTTTDHADETNTEPAATQPSSPAKRQLLSSGSPKRPKKSAVALRTRSRIPHAPTPNRPPNPTGSHQQVPSDSEDQEEQPRTQPFSQQTAASTSQDQAREQARDQEYARLMHELSGDVVLVNKMMAKDQNADMEYTSSRWTESDDTILDAAMQFHESGNEMMFRQMRALLGRSERQCHERWMWLEKQRTSA